jgi:hypothetical protein
MARARFDGQIDARQKILCDNIKAQGITIYTIQVNTSSPPDPTSPVLSYCARGSQNFYAVFRESGGHRFQLDRNLTLEIARGAIVFANEHKKKARPSRPGF